MKTGETGSCQWKVLPEDATNKELTFRSLQPKIATVDANGVVTALSRGTGHHYAYGQGRVQAAGQRQGERDPAGDRRSGNAAGPVLCAAGDGTTIRAVVQPKNANNQRYTGPPRTRDRHGPLQRHQHRIW